MDRYIDREGLTYRQMDGETARWRYGKLTDVET